MLPILTDNYGRETIRYVLLREFIRLIRGLIDFTLMFHTKIEIPALQLTVEILTQQNTEEIRKATLINFVITLKK